MLCAYVKKPGVPVDTLSLLSPPAVLSLLQQTHLAVLCSA